MTSGKMPSLSPSDFFISTMPGSSEEELSFEIKTGMNIPPDLYVKLRLPRGMGVTWARQLNDCASVYVDGVLQVSEEHDLPDCVSPASMPA